MVQLSMKATTILRAVGVNVTIANARFCKPFDIILITLLAKEHEILFIIHDCRFTFFSNRAERSSQLLQQPEVIVTTVE
ncbi:hypothetical protein RYX36_013612 [Vicia faba]